MRVLLLLLVTPERIQANANPTAGRFPAPVALGAGDFSSVPSSAPISQCSAGVVGCMPTAGVKKAAPTFTPAENPRMLRPPKCTDPDAVGCLRYPMSSPAPYGLTKKATAIYFHRETCRSWAGATEADACRAGFNHQMSTLVDVDGDGDLDSGLMNTSPGGLSGHITWQAVAGAGASAGVIGDLDNDGDLDAIRTDGMYMNDGTGVFTKSNLPMAQHAKCDDKDTATGEGCIVGDVNGDGWLDVLSGQLYLNDGTGKFTAQAGNAAKCTKGSMTGHALLPPEHFDACVLLDIDGDGDLDLLNKDEGFLNDGTGTFVLDSTLPGCGMRCIAGDLNADGKVDVISETTTLMNTGSSLTAVADSVACRSAGAAGAYAAGHAWGCILGDLDADGDVDLIIWKGWGAPKLYVNDGAGNFSPDASTELGLVGGTAYFVLGDIDGDGDLDLFNENGATGGSSLLINEPVEGFVQVDNVQGGVLPWGSSTSLSAAVEVGDVDGDGDVDVVAFPEPRNNMYNGQTAEIPGRKSGVTLVAINDGLGNFAGTTVSDSDANAPRGRMVDINGDGHLDLVELQCWDGKAFSSGPTADTAAPTIKVFLNDGAGNFTHWAAGDLALDRTIDQWGQTSGIGAYEGPSFNIFFYDVDGDGDMDMRFPQSLPSPDPGGPLPSFNSAVITNNYPNAFTIAYDVSTGFKTPPVDKDNDGTLDTSYDNAPGQYGDVDGDGILDLVTFDLKVLKGPAFTHGVLEANTAGGDALTYSAGSSGTPVGKGDTVMLVYVLDIDGDGDNDVWAQLASNDIFYDCESVMFLNRGQGRFFEHNDPFVKYSGEPAHVGFADFDGDGDLDVVRTANDGRMAMFFWVKCADSISLPNGACAEPPTSSRRLQGSDIAVECQAHYERSSLATECQACPLGSERPVGQAECTLCPAGYAIFTADGQGGEGQACIQCQPGSFSNVNGSRSCTTCSIGTYSATAGATSCEQATSGYYAAEGSSMQMQCGIGRYGNTLGNGDLQCTGACDAGYVCPPGSASPTETSIEPACEQGYYLYNATCHACPLGTNCVIGSTLELLPLMTGFYRLNNMSTDVRLCPDGTKNTTGCQGGIGNPCAPGIEAYSTYCELCSEGSDTWYKKASDADKATCAPCSGSTGSMIGMIFAFLGVLAALAIIVTVVRRKMPAPTARRLKSISETLALPNKIKIMLGFYQIATKVPKLYEVSLPESVTDFLDQFSGFVSFGVQGFSTTSLECMGLGGYRLRLLFWLFTPAICLVVVVLVVLGMITYKKHQKKHAAPVVAVATKVASDDDDSHAARFELGDMDGKREATLFEQTLPAALKILFILYPLVTTAAFDGFPCYWFSNGRGWLRADVSIECSTPEHTGVTLIAWIAVALYPIGIMAGSGILLFRASSSILAGKETPLTRAIAFLYKEYDPTSFYWELMEMLRKFLLVGLFVTFQPGSILQITLATIVCATYLMVQLQAAPYKNQSDDFAAAAASFSLLMVFFCSILYKFDALTTGQGIQLAMTGEQKDDYIVSALLLSFILILSVVGSLIFAVCLVAVQIIVEIKNNAKLRRIKYSATGKWLELEPAGGGDPQAFHLFLSHAWPAAQDRMRIVKARFLECLPSCRTFLDVDDLKSGSGTAEVDKSECILVFCTNEYFKKKNSLKELYRAVVQRRPILAMLEPDHTQEGGFNQAAIEGFISNKILDKFKLRKKHKEWGDDGELLPAAFDHAPDEAEVRTALFANPPVEWNRLPHFQDVTIRLIAQGGILRGNEMLKAQAKGNFTIAPMSVEAPELYLQGEAATGKISLPPPLKGREFHLFCSEFNAGAKEFAEELRDAPVFATKGKAASVPLTYTTDVAEVAQCDHMLVLLDARTFTSGDDTAKFVEHMHAAMRAGVHMNCIHEFPSVVGPARYECEFALMFGDDWTPAHLTGGKTNLYKEIAFALKGVEWRQPGLVAVASKIAASAAEHKPIEFEVPATYVPKKGSNKWKTGAGLEVEALVKSFDTDKDHVVSVQELHDILKSVEGGGLSYEECGKVFDELLAKYDTNMDGEVSIEEVAVYVAELQKKEPRPSAEPKIEPTPKLEA